MFYMFSDCKEDKTLILVLAVAIPTFLGVVLVLITCVIIKRRKYVKYVLEFRILWV